MTITWRVVTWGVIKIRPRLRCQFCWYHFEGFFWYHYWYWYFKCHCVKTSEVVPEPGIRAEGDVYPERHILTHASLSWSQVCVPSVITPEALCRCMCACPGYGIDMAKCVVPVTWPQVVLATRLISTLTRPWLSICFLVSVGTPSIKLATEDCIIGLSQENIP